MNQACLERLSKHELRIISEMAGIKLEETLKKNETCDNLGECYEEIHDKSPFKLIILDIRSILPKKGCRKIKRGFKYVEEMKELTSLKIEKFRNNLIKVKNDLIEKFK